MDYIVRNIERALHEALSRGKSILLLGPRQVGKSTTVASLNPDHLISLAKPALRQRYERDIGAFTQEVELLSERHSGIPLLVVDEVQKVPELMDAVQDLIDREVAQFVLTGSSARKLRHGRHVNWLPGRVVSLQMDPFQLTELPEEVIQLESLLLYGALPGVCLTSDATHKEKDLESYVVTYLEEEVRHESLVRHLGHFSQFLTLAASESGKIVNFNKLSQEVGVAQTTTQGYYQILEDCLIAERIEPVTKNRSRRRLTKSPRYVFFDLGVRRLAAYEGDRLSDERMGHLFEQFVGLELLRMIRLISPRLRLKFWRELDGREVDWVLEGESMIPIEVKWTDRPSAKHAKHLHYFLDEYDLDHGYIVCRVEADRKISDRITAISWKRLFTVFDGLA